MFAIIQSGGKQYRVQEGDVVRVESLQGEAGDKLELKPILIGGGHTLLGDEAARFTVTAEVVEHGLGQKIYVRKYKSGIQYRRRNGHRQQYTAIRITSIA
ncbi:50S ribosomal protein L21 [Deinococcus metallilatus]|uniref:Large ribosomal subunit protein bL21 n=2 Tax=Deinococcus TaxID=1298 RepID=A0AAJ5F4W6_9DEIO|nr:50S ribosomal protein L21 [Deinococcus metallilatus]MBB5294694.1 large subunit ribosomal protein L21 [Deinococcus metallilatus]QBY07724.1 50S ribosomal protein L21 [Deinococcus metallilatus]RXJ14140.1 50S ribosomal protein L21 [Deinococcus metallilatus]TLK30105.1 50S ribosomal protein L21 [Deinococcus metallilatus]GMA15911.1 50S ribosomal protein L21 [Deinococcus metallilatus]